MDEMLEKSLSDLRDSSDVAEFLSVSQKQLNFIVNAIQESKKYSTYQIPKKRGGHRIIQAPLDELKLIQHRLAEKLYDIYKPRSAVHGFCIDKSIVTNAIVHVRARYIFNVDLRVFFPSINFGRVRGMFLKPPYNVTAKAATILAKICCNNNCLPQGSPTSPIISNMICSRLDGQLTKLAEKYRCFYTR